LTAKRFNIKFFSHTYLQPYRNIVRTTQYCDRSEVATDARVSAHKAVGAFITAQPLFKPEFAPHRIHQKGEAQV
jgi:hypothetical protein